MDLYPASSINTGFLTDLQKVSGMNVALNQGYNQLGIGQFINQLKSQMKIM